MHFLPLVLACLAPQQIGERRPVSIEPAHEPNAVVLGDTELRFYELGGLTGHDDLGVLLAALSRSDDPLDVPTALGELERLELQRAQVASTTHSLIGAARDMLEPPFVEGVNRIAHLERGRVAVVASRLQHDWLAAFLKGAAAFDGMVDIQARIHVLGKGELARLGRSRSGQVLSEVEASALLLDLEALESDRIQAPRVLVLPFQEATLSAIDEVAYIQDYELKVIPDRQLEVADPVIGIARSGIDMRLRSVPLATGELSIDAHLDYSTLAEPIPSVETTLGASGQKVTLQLPEITRIRVEGRFRVVPGQTLMIASADPEGEREVLVLVRAVCVPAQRQGGAQGR